MKKVLVIEIEEDENTIINNKKENEDLNKDYSEIFKYDYSKKSFLDTNTYAIL